MGWDGMGRDGMGLLDYIPPQPTPCHSQPRHASKILHPQPSAPAPRRPTPSRERTKLGAHGRSRALVFLLPKRGYMPCGRKTSRAKDRGSLFVKWRIHQEVFRVSGDISLRPIPLRTQIQRGRLSRLERARTTPTSPHALLPTTPDPAPIGCMRKALLAQPPCNAPIK